MDYLHKLPFITGSFMAIVVGAINYKFGVDQHEIYTRMAISLVLFFIVGLIIRNMLTSLLEELEKRRKEQEELEEQQRLAELHNHSQEISDLGLPGSESEIQNRINQRLDAGDEFVPLKVSELMNSTDGE